MPLPPITSFLNFRWMTLLAVIYAVVAGVEIEKEFKSATYNREVFRESVTAPLEGTKTVQYTFLAQHSALKGLWVFFDVPSGASSEGRLVLTMGRANAALPFWSQSFDCRQSQFIGPAQLCQIGGLTLEQGERYVLTYSMPDLPPGTGWRLFCSTLEGGASTVQWDSQTRASTAPSMLWLERHPRYPVRSVLAGAFLLLLCSAAAGDKTAFRIPALVILVSGCVLSATYYWQLHLWQFWGNFWPDGYPRLSYKVQEFFTGRISFRACLSSFQSNRCGQAFAVPLSMGVFQALGLSIKGSYLATNAMCLGACGALLLGFLRLQGVSGDRAIMASALLFFSHHCFIGAVAEFQTDLAGVAATLLFVYLLLRAFKTESAGRRLVCYIACGVAAFLACTVRIALLSLPLIPACLFLWSLFCERQRPWRERIHYLIPTAVGITLLVASWSALGLWGTFDLDWAFAKEFSQLFSWKGFLILAVQGVQLGLVAILVLWRRLFDDRGFAAVAGSTFSLLSLLAYTHSPTWLRYMDPPAVLGVILCIWILKTWPRRDAVFLAVAWMSALLNGFIE